MTQAAPAAKAPAASKPSQQPEKPGLVPVAPAAAPLANTGETSLAIPEYTGEGGGGAGLAYLMYYGPKAGTDRAIACKEAGVLMHTFYLKDALGVVKLNTPRIFIVGDQTACYAKFDDQMRMLAAKPYTPNGAPEGEGNDRWSEYRVGMVLVPNNEDDSLAPVVFSTNGPSCNLWKAINTAQAQSKGAGLGFAGRSAAHKAAVAHPQACARFFAEISGKEETSPNGFKFNKTYATIKPTPKALQDLVANYLVDPGIEGLKSVYARRKEDIAKLIAKTA